MGSAVETVVAAAGALVAALAASVAFEGFAYFIESESYDEDVNWTTQPLEVVADSDSEGCLINAEAVAPGLHEVRVVAVGSDTDVTIEEPDGTVIFRSVEHPGAVEGSDPPALDLRKLGVHRVHCGSGADPWGSTSFRVMTEDELVLG